MIYNFISFLNEDADKFSTFMNKNGIEVTGRDFEDDDAFCFGYNNLSIYKRKEDRLKKINRNFLTRLFFRDEIKRIEKERNATDTEEKLFHYKTIHKLYNKLLTTNKEVPILIEDNKKYFMFPGEIGLGDMHGNYEDRNLQKYPGRVWNEKKVISFWINPETYDNLMTIIKDIDMAYEIFYDKKLNIYNNRESWNIEVYNEEKGEHKVIPLTSYKSSNNDYDSMKLQHIKIGKGGNKYMKKTQWKKWMKPFESFKNEK